MAIGSHRLAAYNIHLESRGTDGLRIGQLRETLEGARRYKDAVPSVIGGDFNLVASEGMAAEVLGEAGFHDTVGSRSPTTRGARPRRIDGLFVRGGTSEGGAAGLGRRIRSFSCIDMDLLNTTGEHLEVFRNCAALCLHLLRFIDSDTSSER